MKIQKRKIFIFVLILFLVLSGCRAKKEDDSEEKADDRANDIIEAINNYLVEKKDERGYRFTSRQIAFLKSYQWRSLQMSGFNSSWQSSQTMAVIFRGILLALGHYSEDEVVGDTKNEKSVGPKSEIMKAASEKALEIFKEEGYGGQEFSKAMGAVFSETVSYFDSAGLTQARLIAVVGELSASVLTHAAAIELSADDIADMAVSITKNIAANLGGEGAGLLGKLVPQAIENILPKIFKGMQDGGVSNDDIVAKLTDIVEAAVVGLGDIPDLAPEDLGLAIKTVEKGANKGLEAIGLENAQIQAQSDDIGDAIDAAAKKLADEVDKDIFLSDGVLEMSEEAPTDLIEDISLALFSLDSETGFQLSAEQIDNIKKAMESKAASASDSKLETVVKLVFEGVKIGIDDISPELSNDEKTSILKETLEMSVTFLTAKVVDEQYGDKTLSDALEIISKKAINPLLLDMTGDPSVFREIAEALISPLDLVPTAASSIDAAARVIVQGIVSAIDETGLNDAGQSEALNSALSGALEAVQAGDFNLEELKKSEGQITAGAVEGLMENQKDKIKESLDSGSPEAEQILDDIIDEVMDAMKEAGALDIAGLADDIVEGAFDALKEDEEDSDGDEEEPGDEKKALNPAEIAEALDKVIKKTEESLEENAKSDDGEISEDEQKEIDEAVQDMLLKEAELIAQLAPPGSPDMVLSSASATTIEYPQDIKVIGVNLDSQPEQNIAVTIESQNTEEGIVQPSSLTFTPDNWYKKQDVSIISQDDGKRDGNIEYLVVFSTDSGIRKTVNVTNVDDDVIGLRIEPFGEQLYAAAYGGPIDFLVHLRSKPFDEIELNWALDEGKEAEAANGEDAVDFIEGKKMTFKPEEWNVYKKLTVQPIADEISEQIGVGISSLAVKSVNGTDVEYPKMDVYTLPMVVVRALKMQKLDIETIDATSAIVKLTFRDELFVNKDKELDPDVKLIYEKAISDQTFDMKYAPSQVEPQCLSTMIKITETGEATTDNTIIIPPFEFSVKFYNATKRTAELAIMSWLAEKAADVTTDSTTDFCSGDESTEIICTYAASEGGATLLGQTFAIENENSVFSPSGVGNSAVTPIAPASFTKEGDDAFSDYLPGDYEDPTSDVKITFQFYNMTSDSTVTDDDLKKAVVFISVPGQETTKNGIKAGFWTLDSWSSSLSRVKESESDANPRALDLPSGPEPYGTDHYLYIKVE